MEPLLTKEKQEELARSFPQRRKEYLQEVKKDFDLLRKMLEEDLKGRAKDTSRE